LANHTKATTQALDKIDRLDLKEVADKAAKDFGWSPARAGKAEVWYKNFLKLCYLNRRSPVAALGRDADELWHRHILDTSRYQRDCEDLFGHYLNHEPIYGQPTPADREAMARTREMYLAEYGALPVLLSRVCVHKPKPPPPPPPHRRRRKSGDR
jgi:hypothetical protein